MNIHNNISPLSENFYKSTRKKLLNLIHEKNLDGCLVTNPANIFYFTGFFYVTNERPSGFYLSKNNKTKLFIPLLEKENSEWIILNGCIALLYPLWLSLLNSANWDVFGDKDQSQLTITGAMIFALLISFSSGILSAIQQTFLGAVPMEQALQYTVHFVVGDTLGTGVVIFLFYKLLQLNIRTQNK